MIPKLRKKVADYCQKARVECEICHSPMHKTKDCKEEIVRFRSEPAYFEKEMAGIKPNTVREIDMGDRRFRSLANGRAHYIAIENTKTTQIFYRRITDVSFWRDYVIISWEPE